MAEGAIAMLHTLLTARPELGIFAALTFGYAIGAMKFGPFQLGGVAGTLLAALIIGQIGVQIDPSLQRFMFTLFIYALGFSVAPQFFASVDKTTWSLDAPGNRRDRSCHRRGICRRVFIQAGCRDGKWSPGRSRDRICVGRYRERGNRQTGAIARGYAGISSERRNLIRAMLHFRPYNHRVVCKSGGTQAARY